jgi:hypothetical protein
MEEQGESLQAIFEEQLKASKSALEPVEKLQDKCRRAAFAGVSEQEDDVQLLFPWKIGVSSSLLSILL